MSTKSKKQLSIKYLTAFLRVSLLKVIPILDPLQTHLGPDDVTEIKSLAPEKQNLIISFNNLITYCEVF